MIAGYLAITLMGVAISCRSSSQVPPQGSAAGNGSPSTRPRTTRPAGFSFPAAEKRNADLVNLMNVNCVACHKEYLPPGGGAPLHDSSTMHTTVSGTGIACVDCHGGNQRVKEKDVPPDITPAHPEYDLLKNLYHYAKPNRTDIWRSSANP